MSYSDFVKDRLDKTPLKMTVDEWKRLQLKSSLPLAGVIAASIFFITRDPLHVLIAFIGSFVGAFLVILFSLDYMAYKRAIEIEEILPEALEMIASNVKAGMPVKEALQMIMSDEFGQLADEMTVAVTEMNTGISMVAALQHTKKHVDSTLYGKSIDTMCRSIEGGVNMATISSQMARNINDMRNIRREVSSSTVAYTLFLSFAALIASPILFALSTFLVEASTEIFSVASAQGQGGSALGLLAFSATLPPVELLSNFFFLAITITSVSTSIGVGIVRRGSMRVGIKYVPVFLSISFIVFFIAKSIIESIVGLSI